MLTDESEDNKDTWEFLERRLDGLERAEAAIRVGNIQNLIQSTRTIAERVIDGRSERRVAVVYHTKDSIRMLLVSQRQNPPYKTTTLAHPGGLAPAEACVGGLVAKLLLDAEKLRPTARSAM
eukprot:scaffold2534_cov260-Pinguiococcus_pyrenoidosus.AAC.16